MAFQEFHVHSKEANLQVFVNCIDHNKMSDFYYIYYS